MTPNHIATITMETWRASGLRTEARRNALMAHYLEAYYGPESTWSADINAIRDAVLLQCRRCTRIDELKYL